jgi:acetoin utilization deacetylase AcuC-like enzyme
VQAGRAAADHDHIAGAFGLRDGGGHGAATVLRITLYLSHPSSYEHDTGPHPENAGRLTAIEQALAGADGLTLERVEAPAASRDQILRVHTPEHYGAIEAFCADGGGNIDADTIVVGASFGAALHAAGGAVAATDRLLAGDARAAFCALRPPGHHAERSRAMGFCLFNNVAVAAAHAITAGGAERVLILDWDVHHGNGTEEIFAARSDVLYASIHEAPLYPGTGPASYAGDGKGEGFTVNLPVAPGSGSEEFLALIEHVIAPIAREFEPGLIAISAGYDAHRDDPLASCAVDTDGYGEMTAAIRDLGAVLEAPVLVCLEGGYSPAALGASVVATLGALDDDTPAADADPAAAEPHLSRLRAEGRWAI